MPPIIETGSPTRSVGTERGNGMAPLNKPRSLAMRIKTGRTLIILALTGAVLMLAPTLTRGQWVARLALSEVSPLVGLLALLGLAALPPPDRRKPLVLWPAVMAALISALPFAFTLPAFAVRGRVFSPLEFLTWGGARPAVVRASDLLLEPSRPDLLLDLYRGVGDGLRPLILLVHGGSFSGGDKGENRVGSEIFASAGFSVADVRYRLAPGASFPAAVQDVKCLLGRLRERAREFAIDTEKVVYLGRSAGASIAIVAAYSAGDSRLPPACGVEDRKVSGMVSLYGPLDLEWGWRQRPFPDPLTGYAVLERYVGGTPQTNSRGYQMASATFWAGPASPRTLLIHGARDSLVSPYHITLLKEAFARNHGEPPQVLIVPFADHGFDYHPGGLAEQLARAEILEFLGSVLR